MVQQNVTQTSPLAKRGIIFAIAAFIVMFTTLIGLFGNLYFVFGFGSIVLYGVALYFGIKGLKETTMNPRLKGRTLAIISVIVSSILSGLFFLWLLAAFGLSGAIS